MTMSKVLVGGSSAAPKRSLHNRLLSGANGTLAAAAATLTA